jgi:hypothetical protein
MLWLAAGIAVGAGAGLCAEIAVEGVSQAAGLAGVIAGFCELGALVMGVAGLAGEHRITRGDAERTAVAPALETAGKVVEAGAENQAGKYTVDLRQARMVQVGDHSFQLNHLYSQAFSRGQDGAGD